MDSGEMLTPEENARRKKEREKSQLEGVAEGDEDEDDEKVTSK